MHVLDLLEDLKKYVLETLGIEIDSVVKKIERNLPVFLQDGYSLYSAVILDKPYILVIAEAAEETSPAQIFKHLLLIEEKTKSPCIYISQSLPAYSRQRLVMHRVRFVIPGTQMYLPDLGIDCRKTASKKTTSLLEGLTPSAQAVLIHVLLQGNGQPFTPSQLAETLHYTRMTMTRALNELEARGLGRAFRQGKERWFHFPEKKKLWDQALPLMRTPIKESLWIRTNKVTIQKIEGLGCIAGLTALAKQSMLAPPAHHTFALSLIVWKTLLDSKNIEILPFSEEANIQVEIWKYDPTLFAEDSIVDPLSLFLSLQGTADERVEAALEKVIGEIKW